ncbi:hypothetical protein EDC25_10244 [Pseudofulvimonas gallinarii]|jgi:hypothetical protein|uniref:HipA-like kinase domain-containing protein n=1 Tax=Pseudofulvimonas gallinarii TaxID=634155 RepID=A0A4R3LK62_9GAMM|nr:HipA family kinase [Pseudofulvimonas gallinarii]TCT00680.1 hypothetical protein EDC25_10244 [Pseudofulvimonas gallinarii]
MSLRRITVERYVTPLREGGSMPAVVEADDLGLYVLKFRGAGQGVKALIAELVAGELARALELPVPEIVLADLDPELARTEADPEIQELVRASGGLNLALDYLPGAANFDAASTIEVPPELASRIVWFDAFVSNVDRSTRNPNLMLWHRRLWLIDHGAALYIHHGWDGSADNAGQPFKRIADHVLLRWADAVGEVDADMAARLTPAVIEGVLALVPDAWLEADTTLPGAAGWRAAYTRYLCERLRLRAAFVAEAERAHALL